MAEAKKVFKDVPATTLLRRFKEAEKAKEKYNGTWARNIRLWRTEAWVGIEKIAWFQSEPEYNKVFEFVETMRGFLSDNKWGMDVIPAVIPGDMQKALDGDRDINVATGITMVQYRLQRAAAFELMRASSRSQRRKLAELAREVIQTCDSLHNSPKK